MATRRNRKWLRVDRNSGPARTEDGSILLQARAAFSPHKDPGLINLIASLRVPRRPRSAARRHTNAAHRKYASHSAEPMSTCFRCVFAAQEFVSPMAEFNFPPHPPPFYTNIGKIGPVGQTQASGFPDSLIFFGPLTNHGFNSPARLKPLMRRNFSF